MDEKQNKKKSEILSWIQIIVVAAVIAFLLNNFIIANSRVPSGSMENTIMTGNRIIGNRLQYKFSDPKRGDIVMTMKKNILSKELLVLVEISLISRMERSI